MSTDTKELIEICAQLPEAKRVEVADFARFLLAKEGDERWEQIIADPKPRPKLDALLKDSKQEPAEPLDLDRLCLPLASATCSTTFPAPANDVILAPIFW